MGSNPVGRTIFFNDLALHTEGIFFAIGLIWDPFGILFDMRKSLHAAFHPLGRHEIFGTCDSYPSLLR